MIRQHLYAFLTGLFSGLLAAGLVILFLSRPQQHPIRLLPPPTPAPLKVHVTGAVHQPEVYLLPINSILKTALEAAGGQLPEADLDRINLAAPIVDGQQIFIPYQAIDDPSQTASAPDPASPEEPIDLNLATQVELEKLPGIGPSLAQKIVEYRLEHGLYLEVDELLNVSGIGPAKLDQIRALIRCQ